MRAGFRKSAIAIVAGAATIVFVKIAPVTGQTQGQTAGQAIKTAWGEPDLQGIWTYELDTPLQRSPKYANEEFFTEEQSAQLDKERMQLLSRDKRVERGSELDVAGAYNAVFLSFKKTGLRTWLIVDPPNGRVPPQTAEAQKFAAEDRDFRLALLQATETCKSGSVACRGGKDDPNPSPRRDELSPRYNTGRMNRWDNPEDGSLSDRCLALSYPEFGTAFGGSFRRIIQTPNGIAMYYDVGQGQGWPRTIVMNGSPHLPPSVRQWWGDSRGRWEGDTLVVDTTNFSPKGDFQGSRENLHTIERWTRLDASTLRFQLTIEDPTVWTSPWTVRQEFTRQSDEANRVYYEPRCAEGEISKASMLLSQRLAEASYAEGRGPHPATKDNATDFVGVEENPLQ